MSNPNEAPDAEMLPGLRAAVGDARTRAAETRRRNAANWVPADSDPVARVLVDLPLPHLDKPFDYAVPTGMADTALPGTRVKVRFAGRDVDAFVLARARHDCEECRVWRVCLHALVEVGCPPDLDVAT